MLKSIIHFKKGAMGAIMGIAAGLLVFSGCAASKQTFAPDVSGPQLIVNPGVIRTGAARLKDTPIIFKGRGFRPDDSVFIAILDVDRNGRKVNVPIAESDVNENGEFTAEVEMLVKVTELLMADLGMNEDMQTVIIVSQPPIEEGVYTVRAESMEHDQIASCRLEIRDPTILDRFKDWLGVRFGKIQNQ